MKLLIFFILVFFLSFNLFFGQSNLAFALDDEINYELPYPGLLPDSPLYFLKILRDKTVEFLISDPLKKAEFDLLAADKRLNAGLYLVRKNKMNLAVSTISKAENYFEEALGKAKEAKNQKLDVSGIAGKMIASSKKHKFELRKLSSDFEKEKKRAENFGIAAAALLSNK